MERETRKAPSSRVRPGGALCIAVLLFGAFVSALSAEENYWEGSVAVSAYGRLPQSGMYAASDAFPLDTKVTVRNMENGRSVEVRVVERLDDPRIFMRVSPAAAEELGIASDEMARAKVRPAGDRETPLDRALAEERAYTPDPDRNPAAEVSGEGERLVYGDEEPAAEGETASGEAAEEAAEEERVAEEPETAQVKAAEPAEKEKEVETAEPEAPREPAGPEAEEVRAARTTDGEELPESRDTPQVRRTEAGEGEPVLSGMAVRSPAEQQQEPQERMPVPELRVAVHEEPSEEPSEKPERAEPAVAEGPQPEAPAPLFPRRSEPSWDPAPPEAPAERTAAEEGPFPSLRRIDSPEEGATLAQTANIPRPPEGRTSLPAAAGTPVAETGRLALAEPQLPEERPRAAEKERPVAEEPEEEAEEPKPIPDEAELVLRPAEERPPEGPVTEREAEEKPEEEAEERAETAAEEKPAERAAPPEMGELLTEELKEARYYLQVGAYKEAGSAGRLARNLAEHYPVQVYTGERGTGYPYKVMVGPLSEDESGAVLYAFRSRGYRDAFLRRGR